MTRRLSWLLLALIALAGAFALGLARHHRSPRAAPPRALYLDGEVLTVDPPHQTLVLRTGHGRTLLDLTITLPPSPAMIRYRGQPLPAADIIAGDHATIRLRSEGAPTPNATLIAARIRIARAKESRTEGGFEPLRHAVHGPAIESEQSLGTRLACASPPCGSAGWG